MSTKFLRFYIENGSYIKLKSLTLGYTLPKAALDKMKMRHARIYFQAQEFVYDYRLYGCRP